MAKVPLTADHVKRGTFVLNVESVGLRPRAVFRLCGDNPELRLELTAQKEIIVMNPELPGFTLDPTKSGNNAINAMSLLETCASVAILSAVVFFAAPSLIRARENYHLDLTTRQVAGRCNGRESRRSAAIEIAGSASYRIPHTSSNAKVRPGRRMRS